MGLEGSALQHGNKPNSLDIYTDMVYLACAEHNRALLKVADDFAVTSRIPEQLAQRVKRLLSEALSFNYETT